MYGYVSVAEEAGVTLADFPEIQTWLRRLEALPGHLPAEIQGGAQ
jgi:glutathione S-transferase